MKIQVISNFNLDKAINHARRRCFWFIDNYFNHQLTSEQFNELSTEELCRIYNIDKDYFN